MPPAGASVSNLVDLPELIQTIATQRRSGTLMVQLQGQVRRLYFNQGQLIAINGLPPVVLARCLSWSEVLKPAQVDALLKQVGDGYTEIALLEMGAARGVLTKDAILDALDCYIEECFTEILGWTGCEYQFVTSLNADHWAAWQAKLGVSAAPSGVLLECLRRQDELKSVAGQVPDRWDVLIREPTPPGTAELGKDERLLLSEWRDARIFDDLLHHPLLPPFRATRSIVRLRQQAFIRIGSAVDLVVQADAANAHQQYQKAYHVYLRAIDLGMDSPRIHLHVAELAEKLGDNVAAGKYYVSAATLITDPGSSVIALRNAIRLGADREDPLLQLFTIYTHLGEKDDAVTVLLELAELYETRKSLDQAAQAVREAQELGADPAACARILARLALAEGDIDGAVLQYELVARAAEDLGHLDEAAEALRHLRELQPKRFDYATKYAEVLAALERKDEAAAELQRVLEFQAEASEEVLLVVYELCARLNPNDLVAHQWLAEAYRRRKNRDGATAQLKLMVAAQEREGDFGAMAKSLEHILEVGGEQIDVLKRLAVVYSRLGMEGKASAALARAVDAALALGQLREARGMCEAAIEMDPGSLSLRSRLALVANREGDRESAITHYRGAADLARGQGKFDVAQQLLLQLRKLRPDDLVVRLELADVAKTLADANLDPILRDVTMFAVRTKNYGVALECARQRVELAGGKLAFDARSEVIELLRRMGDTTAELQAGKEMLDDLLELGEFDRAVTLLQRLVASNPRNADLVLQLADILASLGDARQAQRFYRHGVSLLQLESRIDEARAALDHLEQISDDPEAIARARELLTAGQPLEWEAIRFTLEQDMRRKLEGEIESASGKHQAKTE